MANKPTVMLKLKRVLQLRLNGDSKSLISRKIPIHRNVLDKYLALIDQSGQSYEALLYRLAMANFKESLHRLKRSLKTGDQPICKV